MQAARNLGVPVDRITIILFMICSALGAVTGVIQVARFSSVDALRGEGMELQAVAVTVIGGTLLSGGYGSVIGTMLGAITFGMIQVGLVLAGAPGHFFKTLTGLIVVGAVILNTDVARRMATLEAARRLPAQQRRGRCRHRRQHGRLSATKRPPGETDHERRDASPGRAPGDRPHAAPTIFMCGRGRSRRSRRTPCRSWRRSTSPRALAPPPRSSTFR